MKQLVAIVHNIRSLHNVGSMFRTADGAGVSKMFLIGVTPTPTDRFGAYRKQLAKVALGAEQTVPWEHHRSPVAMMKRLKREGFFIVALEQSKRSVPYNTLKAKKVKKGKYALVVGNEVRGLPPSVLNFADEILEIPMRGNKESLNVSVAFGIAVYELTKQ